MFLRRARVRGARKVIAFHLEHTALLINRVELSISINLPLCLIDRDPYRPK